MEGINERDHDRARLINQANQITKKMVQKVAFSLAIAAIGSGP